MDDGMRSQPVTPLLVLEIVVIDPDREHTAVPLKSVRRARCCFQGTLARLMRLADLGCGDAFGGGVPRQAPGECKGQP